MSKDNKNKGLDDKNGMVVIQFIVDEPGNPKGDKRTYHKSTADTLIAKGKAKLVKELEGEYVPKAATK